MRSIVAMLLSLPFLCACAGSAGSAAVSLRDLAAKRFVLTRVNDQSFVSKERTPEIEFHDGMRVTGGVCNRFMGNGKLENGVLTVSELASTLMLCADQRLNSMERELTAMLREGATVTLDGDNLTLSRGDVTYAYIRR